MSLHLRELVEILRDDLGWPIVETGIVPTDEPPLDRMIRDGITPLAPPAGDRRPVALPLEFKRWRGRGGNGRVLTTTPDLSALVHALVQAGVLSRTTLDVIRAYLRTDDIVLWSCLNITARAGGGTGDQKVHVDHFDGAGNEVVLAIDLDYKPLNTRYFIGSHHNHMKGLGVKGITDKQRRGGEAQGKCKHRAGYEGTRITADTTHILSRKHACVARRIHAYIQQRTVDATAEMGVMRSWMMLFDAGGLHAGGAVEPNGRRIFLTFKRRAFDGGRLGQEQNWPTASEYMHIRDIYTLV